MYQGIDTAARITAAQAAKIRAEGVSFVGRYLVPESYSKALTAKEIAVLRGAGLAILLCWELYGEDMKGGAVKGAEHGARARKLAESMGVPSGTTIFFAADYDVPAADLILCEQYLKAAQAALGNYRAGAYGGERLITYLADRGLPITLWQCVAWSNVFSQSAAVIQYAWQGASDAKEMAKRIGVAVDLNSCEDMRAAGLWMPEAQYSDGNDTIIEPRPWYADAMAWGESTGIMKDGRPNDNLTRAEFITALMRYHYTFSAEDSKAHSGLLN